MIEMNALNIYQMNIYQTLLFMHKVKNNNIHDVFKDSFTLSSNKYNTRNCKKTFLKPMFRTKLGQKSIQFRGPELWNEIIPLELQDIPFNEFKVKLKQICLHLKEEENFF